MTRKEKLVMEIAEVRYELRTLKGQEAVMPEDYYNSHMYQLEVKTNKVYELEEQLKGLKESLEKAKLDTQIKERTEAYYATEQGQAFKRECEEKRILLGNEYDCAESATLELIESHLQATLGKQWRANRLSTSYVELAVVDADNKPIFGQSVSIYYEKKCWLSGERFQINVGTCGSHDLLPEERGYTMADFYIGIGKLHANTELLETIKDALFYYAERIADIQKEVRELDELIKNPTRA